MNKSAKTVSFPCIQQKIGEEYLYLFFASGKELWKYVTVNERDPDKEKGYQRVVSRSRVRKISEYIDSGKIISTSLLISFNSGKFNGNKLVIPADPEAGWVIDGQHRLAGASKSDRDFVFPVVAFVGLDDVSQAEQFVTINREQKGVSSSLYLDLMRVIPGNKTNNEILKERAVDLANIVNKEETSPFFSKIVSVRSPRNREVSLTNWVRKVAPHLDEKNGRLHGLSDDDRARILSNLYKALGQVFPAEFKRAESVFFKTLGFGALMNCFPMIFDRTLSSSGGLAVKDLVKTFRLVQGFNFEVWSQMGTGNAAENLAANDLRQEIMDAFASEVTGKIRT